MPRYEVAVYDERRGFAEVEADDKASAVAAVLNGDVEVEWVDSDWYVSEYETVEVT